MDPIILSDAGYVHVSCPQKNIQVPHPVPGHVPIGLETWTRGVALSVGKHVDGLEIRQTVWMVLKPWYIVGY